MRSKSVFSLLVPLPALVLAGCGAIGDKAASTSTIYGAAVVISVVLLVLYWAGTKERDPWYLLLFASVLIVNVGYFALCVSETLEAALLANRLSYLGSVFLPFSMCMIILRVSNIRCRNWLTVLLLGLHLLMSEEAKHRAASVEAALSRLSPEPLPQPEPLPALELPPCPVDQSQLDLFAAGLPDLTPKEQTIYRCYVDGMTTSEILVQLNIKENTLKFHNRNLYSKLGVSSRKQMVALHKTYTALQQKADIL